MGEDGLTLYYSLPQHVEIPVGSYCDFQGSRYVLMRPGNFKMRHTRNFEYTVVMESSQAKTRIWKFRNPVDGRLQFSLTATAAEHLQMLVDNLNMRDTGWKAGECVDSTEKLVTYSHAYCSDALTQMAETFNTEYEITGKTVSLKKVEYNRDNPLALAYGKGKGFRPGVGRSNFDDSMPVSVLYVQGGTRNIDAGKYGNSELLLPKDASIRYDGSHFEGEDGFDASRARTYSTDGQGYYIMRQDMPVDGMDDSLDCSEVYPHRDEKVVKVITVDAGKNWYDVVTDTPESLDYSRYGIGGETPTVVFQDGMLAGRELDLETDDDGNIICEWTADGWRFRIVPAEMDGIVMPGGSFLPTVGNIFRVFGIQLPEAYIEEDTTRSGAAWDMFREGVRHLYDNEDRKFTFTGELDGIWAKKDWVNIGGKIKLGGFVSFSDDRFQPEPVLIRITGIKDYINNPYSPEIELSNSPARGGVSSTLKQIDSNKAAAEELYSSSVNFTKRRFRDAKETLSMLEEAMLSGFTDSISPITVQTMSLLVGDESLQFRFVQSKDNPQPVAHTAIYDDGSKILSIAEGTIQHMTLGIRSITVDGGHASNEYRFWTVPAFESPVLSESQKAYYVYVKVSRTQETGVFYMSESAKKMDAEADSYYLLMGILNSEMDGSRSYVSLYGFSEILPGRITTDVIRDSAGNLIIDLAQALITARNGARISGNLTIGPGSSGLENLDEWSSKQQALEEAQDAADAAQERADAAQSAATQAQAAADDAADDAMAANTQLTNIMSDSVISPPEKTALKQQHSDIKTEYSQIIADSQKYGVSTTAYTNAYNSANAALTKYTAASPENIAVGSDYGNISAYYTARQTILDVIAAAAKKVADDAQAAADDAQDTADAAAADASQALKDADAAQKAAQAVRGDLTDLSGTVDDLDEYVDGAFRDGVISEAESSSIKNYINLVNESWTDLQASYNVVYNNANLTGTPKTNLKNAYDTLSARKSNLITAINTAVSNPSSTNVAAVDTAFTSYNSAVSAFKTSLENANKAIQDMIKNLADTANGDLDDIEYLKTVFPDSNLISEGALIGRMVGVTDKSPSVSGAKVVAGLNGTDIGKDSTHGKVLMFAGSGGVTDADIKGAKTKIYEDGTISTTSLEAKNGTIGDLSITGGTLIGDGVLYGARRMQVSGIHSNFVLDADAYDSLVYMMNKSGTTVSHTLLELYLDSTTKGASYPLEITNNQTDRDPVAIMVNRGAISLSEGDVSIAKGNVVVSEGHISGMRGQARVVSSSVTLSKLDYNVLALGTGTLNLTLPYGPQDGQHYRIWKPNKEFTLTVRGNGRIIHRLGTGDSSSVTISSADVVLIEVTYFEEHNKWFMIIHDYR